jgi:aryl carrier-like protein
MNTTQNSQPLSMQRLREDIARLLHEDPEEIGENDNLIDLGLDSIRAMALVTRWREAGAAVEFSDLAASNTLAEWWPIIERSLASNK